MEKPLRRIVVWADGSPRAASWAARHAAARAVPLHVLHFPRVVAAAGALPETGARGFAADSGAVDTLDVVRAVHQLRAAHAHLAVTVELVQDGRTSPDGRLIGPGDILVTGQAGYRDLAESHASEGAADGSEAACVPVVIIPERRPAHGNGARRVLLMIGRRLSPAAATFAFTAAEDLGLPLDAVRIAPDDGAFGDDYWIDPMRSCLVSEPHLRDHLSALHAQHPGVRTSFSTLRTEPWMTLRAMADAAQLAVLDESAECAVDLHWFLERGLCPVAVIPEDRTGHAEPTG